MIVFVNRAGVQAGALAAGVAAIVNPDLAEKTLEDKVPAVTAAHRRLLEDLIAGTVDKTLFTPEVATDVLPRVEQSRSQIKSFGPISAIEILERAPKDGRFLHRYRVRFASTNAIFTVMLNAEGKVAGLNLRPE